MLRKFAQLSFTISLPTRNLFIHKNIVEWIVDIMNLKLKKIIVGVVKKYMRKKKKYGYSVLFVAPGFIMSFFICKIYFKRLV